MVALCELVDCVPTQPLPKGISESDFDLGDWSEDRWAWRLEDVQPLPEPIPCRGAMSVWTPPDHIVEAVRAALKLPPGAERPNPRILRLPLTDAADYQGTLEI